MNAITPFMLKYILLNDADTTEENLMAYMSMTSDMFNEAGYDHSDLWDFVGENFNLSVDGVYSLCPTGKAVQDVLGNVDFVFSEEAVVEDGRCTVFSNTFINWLLSHKLIVRKSDGKYARVLDVPLTANDTETAEVVLSGLPEYFTYGTLLEEVRRQDWDSRVLPMEEIVVSYLSVVDLDQFDRVYYKA